MFWSEVFHPEKAKNQKKQMEIPTTDIEEEIQNSKKPKVKRMYIEFQTRDPIDGRLATFKGVVIHTIDVVHKYPDTPTIYGVVVLKKNAYIVTHPYLKLINKVYCNKISSFETKYDSMDYYFDYERMTDNGKKEKKRK